MVGSEAPPPPLAIRSTDEDHHLVSSSAYSRRCRDLRAGLARPIADQVRQEPGQQTVEGGAQQGGDDGVGDTHLLV